MQRRIGSKKLFAIGFLSLSLLLASCGSKNQDLSSIKFTRADCISGIYNLDHNDSAMYIDGYVEVTDPEIDSVLIEVDDPTTLKEFWRVLDQDISVDASGKAKFSFQISDYVKKHDIWKFKLRVVSRQSEPTEWKEYEFVCPEAMMSNLRQTE